ncbi:hypothetical protein [Teichococcus oryzae]|uniref:Uncharacterized protein n=1 Tax=Teichococcus oryzae TaxID=1608942 RepID=A0A5B2TLD5_9PROT|nr:hypothetical protein [Pseudoroseomonas oryzae]KAA2215009.1 hypothetical protein F0Q34_04865 [Pseudoroseomonas oryzae]
MLSQFAPGTMSSGHAQAGAARLTEAVSQCGRLREAARLSDLAAGLLSQAMERLEEHDTLPRTSHPARARHAMAEALALWRAAWALCSTQLTDRPGLSGVLHSLDQAGAALAGGEAGMIPRLAVAAGALRRLGESLRGQLALAQGAIDRIGHLPASLSAADLEHEAGRLRALQLRQSLDGQALGLARLLPDCLRDIPAVTDCDRPAGAPEWTLPACGTRLGAASC